MAGVNQHGIRLLGNDFVGEVQQRVPPGGCVVRTADGEIDARVETQLARATELLRESLAARD